MPRGGFDIGVREEQYTGQEDRRWNQPKLGWDRNRSRTLDVSLFLPAHFSERGALPGGIVLAERADNGKLGPYTPITRPGEKTQTITVTATGGDNDVTVEGVTRENIAITTGTTAAQLKAILVGFPGIDDDSIVVTKAGTVHTIVGDIPTITVEDADATGGTVVAAVTQSPDADGLAEVPGLETPVGHLFSTTKVGIGDGSDLASAADVGVALFWGGGIVYKSYLPAFTGTNLGELDSYAETVLSANLRYED